jgi:hypothetical protein
MGVRVWGAVPLGASRRKATLIRYWIAILVLCPAPALAQPVFFDDFDGNALLPHWGLPRPEDWAYNVSNSMLNVTGLFYPSDPDFPSNGAIMGASYAPQHDFRMDVWMGWEAGARPHALNITVTGAPGGGLADFGFRDEPASGPIPVILAACTSSRSREQRGSLSSRSTGSSSPVCRSISISPPVAWLSLSKVHTPGN